jgi:hypothetical protein
MLDNPDVDEFTPPLPYGTNCSAPMLVGTPPVQYTPTIYCQFDADITTFFDSSEKVDAGIGGTTKQLNDVVVAFLPTSTGNNPVHTLPSPSGPALTLSCVNGCAISGSGSSTIITFTEGAGGTSAVTATGFPTPTLTKSAGTLPTGLTFNAATGLISGTPADGTAGNYPLTFTAANGVLPNAVQSFALTVNRAGLIITASSGTMTYGGTVPTITPSYSGFVNGDTASSLTTQPTCKTTATSTSAPGTYPSSCTGAVDPNYTISYVGGTVTVTGLQISPTSVNFGTVYFDTIGIQFVNLTNTGTTPITISSIKITAPGNALGDYGDVAFCAPFIFEMPGTLGAGKSCTIVVGLLASAKIFSPTASTATLTITDSAAGSPQAVTLTAMVINPQAKLSTDSLNFGAQKMNTTSAAKTVTLTNTGNTPLSLTSITVSGNYALTSGTNACPSSGTVNPSASCNLYVAFAPKSKGSLTGKVTLTDNALFRTQVIVLSGTGN